MCTRIFWSDNPAAKVVSRTMDWSVSDEPKLWSLPAGVERGGINDTITWRSRYRTVTLSMFDSGAVDGMNDQGLGAHLLYLDDAGYATPSKRRAVANTLWAQYLLDTCSTVAEALDRLDGLDVVSVPVRGHAMGGHLALEDVSGDSAIVEPVDGKLVVHHDRRYQVMANAPTFDKQQENLARHAPFGGTLPPPGDITSPDRFVRACYYLNYLPEPQSPREALARVIQLATNVAVPAGAPYDDGGVYPTWWIAAADLSNLTYYHWSMTSPAVTWLELAKVGDRTSIDRIDLQQVDLAPDLSEALIPTALQY